MTSTANAKNIYIRDQLKYALEKTVVWLTKRFGVIPAITMTSHFGRMITTL